MGRLRFHILPAGSIDLLVNRSLEKIAKSTIERATTLQSESHKFSISKFGAWPNDQKECEINIEFPEVCKEKNLSLIVQIFK